MDEEKVRKGIKKTQEAMREHQHKMETDPEYRKRAEEFKRDVLSKLFPETFSED